MESWILSAWKQSGPKGIVLCSILVSFCSLRVFSYCLSSKFDFWCWLFIIMWTPSIPEPSPVDTTHTSLLRKDSIIITRDHWRRWSEHWSHASWISQTTSKILAEEANVFPTYALANGQGIHSSSDKKLEKRRTNILCALEFGLL